VHLLVNKVNLKLGFFVQHRIVPTFMRVDFVCDRMSLKFIRRYWVTIIVLNVHKHKEGKIRPSKYRFYDK